MSQITDTQKLILESDDFVLSEFEKIQYAYQLKQTTRYNVERNESVMSESVAEHVYGLHLLADYFLPLEDIDTEMDWGKIRMMLQYHDIDEIETGDMVGYLKTDADRAREAAAAERVIANFPELLQNQITETLEEYEAHKSKEARFSKALDRIEPMFHLFSEAGKKVAISLKTTREQNDSIKQEILKPYPYLYRFYEVGTEYMEKEGYFFKG